LGVEKQAQNRGELVDFYDIQKEFMKKLSDEEDPNPLTLASVLRYQKKALI